MDVNHVIVFQKALLMATEKVRMSFNVLVMANVLVCPA